MRMSWGLWELLRHSIGMERRNYRRRLDWWLDNNNHRNHFAIEPGSSDFYGIEKLVANGFMRPGRDIPGGLRNYHVTSEGIEAVRAEYHRVKGDWSKAGEDRSRDRRGGRGVRCRGVIPAGQGTDGGRQAMSRGPKLEQIENHDYPTCRVELESADGRRTTVDDHELMPSHEAIKAARRLSSTVNKSHYAAICVVNERTGVTSDRISWAKPGNVLVGCPDCGIVEVKPDVFEHGKAIAGPCGVCGEMLFFA